MEIRLENQNFEELVSQDKLVLVDFYADWCGPCKMLGRTMEELLVNHPELDIVKVNCDDFEELAAQFQVRSIPAVFAMKAGKVVDKFVGAMPLSSLEQFVAKNK